MFKLELPLKDVMVTQPFGANYVDFYKRLGLKGHNGIDFMAKVGCPVLAAHDGIVTRAGVDGTGGIAVELITTNRGAGYKTIYYHLEKVLVKNGDWLKAGQELGLADNTGKYTTGSHLHFGLKEIDDGATINKSNGYRGAVNPAQYLKKDWWRSAAYHRYGRRQVWIAEWKMRFKNAWLHKYRIARGRFPMPDTEETNALVYGGWDVEALENIAMLHNWRHLKKSEYKSGSRVFSKHK